MSARTLYQRRGICDSSSRYFVCSTGRRLIVYSRLRRSRRALAGRRVPVGRYRRAVPVRRRRAAALHDARETARRLPEPEELPFAPPAGEGCPRRKRTCELDQLKRSSAGEPGGARRVGCAHSIDEAVLGELDDAFRAGELWPIEVPAQAFGELRRVGRAREVIGMRAQRNVVDRVSVAALGDLRPRPNRARAVLAVGRELRLQ